MTSVERQSGSGGALRPSHLAPAASLAGVAVVDARGETLGTLHDIIVDRLQATLSFAVIARADDGGLAPLPWRYLTYDERGECYAASVTRDALASAPRITAEDAPDWRDTAWCRRIESHYGSRAAARGDLGRDRTASSDSTAG